MNKYFIVLLFLTSCSTVSPYNQGCRDAFSSIFSEEAHKKIIQYNCDKLEAIRQNEDRIRRTERP